MSETGGPPGGIRTHDPRFRRATANLPLPAAFYRAVGHYHETQGGGIPQYNGLCRGFTGNWLEKALENRGVPTNRNRSGAITLPSSSAALGF